MIQPRLILCNGAKPPASLDKSKYKVIELTSLGKHANVHVRMEDVARVFLKHVTPRLADFLDIAAMVFSTDCGTRRGTKWESEGTEESWSRDFTFFLPVEDLVFWQRQEVVKSLQETLSVVSGDRYRFYFRKLRQRRPIDPFLQYGDQADWPFSDVERVLMFSGGLDSLSGAVDTVTAGGKLVLVTHRSSTVMFSRQRDLVAALRTRYPGQIIHVPVEVNKGENLGREHTQRTRSFLYLALGTVVAQSVKAGGVRFFENGVVSLNLPVSDEAVGTRASRTTHPEILARFQGLCQLITERSFSVDNPFLYKTKVDVVTLMARNNAGDLIKKTSSCTHVHWGQAGSQWHCGACGQCIDRRIAVKAAGQEAHDPEADYTIDVFSGPRQSGYDRNIAVGYVRLASILNELDVDRIAVKFNMELTRATRALPCPRDKAADLAAMLHRHGQTVWRVLEAEIARDPGGLLAGEVASTSLLGMTIGQEHKIPEWRAFCGTIASILQNGLPVICEKRKPANEPDLQRICDGILAAAQDTRLVREYPTLRWCSVGTKADFSAEYLRVWIELKYVRQKRDIRQITEDVAADMTKYAANDRRTLFVVYDPQHLILHETDFSEPVLSRDDVMIHVIR